jgi:hypothetical protein
VFREESGKSFVIDLGDLSRDPWSLLPGPTDFLAEIKTRRYDTITYARSAQEAEDITVFDRKRHRNIALYASKQKLATRGRFYNEDDLVDYDVIDYDIDVASIPERQWIEGRTRIYLKTRSYLLNTITLKLADSLVVQSVVSNEFGRLFRHPRQEPEHAGRQPAVNRAQGHDAHAQHHLCRPARVASART